MSLTKRHHVMGSILLTFHLHHHLIQPQALEKERGKNEVQRKQIASKLNGVSGAI